MFEVGKLPDESVDSLLAELDKVTTEESEGEAERYFLHALALRLAIQVLRCDPQLLDLPLDLVRCESLHSLDAPTRGRLLNKNYRVLVSMCPLSMESRALASTELPPHFGPAVPEVNSVWLKLYLYHLTGSGPPSFCIVKGSRLRRVPEPLADYERLLVTTWGHDPVIIPVSNALLTLNDALSHSAVLVQAFGWSQQGEVRHVPFPLLPEERPPRAVASLVSHLPLNSSCGFVKLLRLRAPHCVPALPPVRRQPPRHSHQTASQRGTGEEASNMSGSGDAMASGGACGDPGSQLSGGGGEPAALDEGPRNGLRGPEAALLLEAELDGVAAACSESDVPQPPSPGGSDVPQPPFPGGSDSDPLPAAADEDDDWLLLGCSFGLPLFDLALCRKVSQRMADGHLFQDERLQRLNEFNRSLGEDLLEFLSQFQAAPDSATSSFSGVPLPTRSLAFVDGRLTVWSVT